MGLRMLMRLRLRRRIHPRMLIRCIRKIVSIALKLLVLPLYTFILLLLHPLPPLLLRTLPCPCLLYLTYQFIRRHLNLLTFHWHLLILRLGFRGRRYFVQVIQRSWEVFGKVIVIVVLIVDLVFMSINRIKSS